MRRLIWAVILIPLLIGAVIAANTLLTQSGFIRIVAPGLVWVQAPALNIGNVTRPLVGTLNQSYPFSIRNSGQLSLHLTETFLGNGSSLFHPFDPLAGTCLVVGATRNDGVNLVISNTTAIGYYVIQVQIGYDSLGC